MKMNEYRSLRSFGVIGVVVLVVSAAGAIFALNPGGGGSNRAGGSPPTEPNRGGPVVCYGNYDVDPGIISMYPIQPGEVVEVKAKENDHVKKGAVLIRLDDRVAGYRLAQAKADYDAAEAQLRQGRLAPEQLKAKREQQQAALEAARRDFAAADLVYQRKKQLLDDSKGLRTPLINPLDVSAAKELVEKAKVGITAEEAKLRELDLADSTVQVTMAEANAAAKKAQLEQAQYAFDKCTMTAPTDGEVLQILVGPGHMLSGHPQQPALIFAPAGPRIVRAEVEQEFANRLMAGQPVTVQDEHGGDVRASGKVARIADWYTRPRSQTQDPTRLLTSDVRTLECVITIDPGQPAFRLGQRVRVSTGR
jgi:multidrug resistance efflux pump